MADFEIIQKDRVTFTGAQEQPLGSTQKSWARCDVFLDIPPSGANTQTYDGYFSVWIWAVAGGTRTLVGSGHMAAGFLALDGNGTSPVDRLVATAHAPCDHFDVTISFQGGLQGLGPAPPPPIRATVVGSDASPDSNAWRGAMPIIPKSNFTGGALPGMVWFGTPVGLRVGLSNVAPSSRVAHPVELVGVHGVTKDTLATARFLQVFDSAAAPVNGAHPLACFLLPANGGSVFVPMDTGLRGYRFQFGVWIAPSTTSETLTLAAADEVGLNGWVR